MNHDILALIKGHDEIYNSTSIKTLAYNYSSQEIGLRHPDGPVGVVFRDQGQADLYAGMSRLLASTDGYIALFSKLIGISANDIVLKADSIDSIIIQGKAFNSLIFNGLPITTFKTKPNGAIIPTKDLQVDTTTGRLIGGYTELENVFEATTLFNELTLTDPQVSINNIWLNE